MLWYSLHALDSSRYPSIYVLATCLPSQRSTENVAYHTPCCADINVNTTEQLE